MADPQSPDEWWALVRQHEIMANAGAAQKEAARQGYWHAGTAVECALKAYLMKREGWNAWPPAFKPEVLTHDLRALMRIAELAVPRQGSMRASWKAVLDWQRNEGYEPAAMPRKVARSMIEAVFGADGVVTWLRENMP